jgi:hypothetical protein
VQIEQKSRSIKVALLIRRQIDVEILWADKGFEEV